MAKKKSTSAIKNSSIDSEFIDEYKKYFNEKLEEFIKDKKITQKEMASKMDFSEYKISDFKKRETSTPGAEFFYKLKKTFPEVYLENWFPPFDQIVNSHSFSYKLWDEIKNMTDKSVVYTGEDPKINVFISQKLQQLEQKSDRFYFSNIFPSGIFRHTIKKKSKKEDAERDRKKNIKSSKFAFYEYYTLSSFFQYIFGIMGERFYTNYEIFVTIDKMNDFIKQGKENTKIYLVDTSYESYFDENKNYYFYGYPITRLVNDDYIVTTELNRIFRFERNKERYEELKSTLESFENKYDVEFFIDILINLKKFQTYRIGNRDKPKIVGFDKRQELLQVFLGAIKKENPDIYKACTRNLLVGLYKE